MMHDPPTREQRMQELYDQVPPMADCKGTCWNSCGPAEMSPWERRRLAAAGHPITPENLARRAPYDFWCDALGPDGRCTVYSIRPLICFLPGSWIYTAGGPKRIEGVYAGEMVYGADGKLHRVTATASRYYTGTVVDGRHTGTHVPCWSTDDHRWLAARQRGKRKTPAPEWRPARELTPKRKEQAGDYLCFPATFEDRSPLEALDVGGGRLFPFTTGGKPVRGIVQDIPARIPVDEEFLFMLGVFLAEGSSSTQAATFTMHPDEVPILDRIGKYLAGLGITSQSRGVTRAAYLTISSALFGRLMTALCGSGAAGKRIHPDLFARLSHRQLWDVYQAWDVGDGRKCHREREMSTVTISEQLAVQMAFVAHANGLFPRTYAGRRPDRGGRQYDVHLFPSNWRDCKPGFGTKNMADEQYVYTPVAGDGQYRSGQEATRHYEGPVFDIQVEGAESFVTSSGIAHNCRLWGAVEWLACPAGCVPAGGWLPDETAFALMLRLTELGGYGHPVDRETFEKLKDPAYVAEARKMLDHRGTDDKVRFAKYGDRLPPAITRRRPRPEKGE
jgi:hypothetical protein